jgi:hypothetical protein
MKPKALALLLAVSIAKEKLEKYQLKCPHKNIFKDPNPCYDCHWYDCKCLDCGKYWKEINE